MMVVNPSWGPNALGSSTIVSRTYTWARRHANPSWVMPLGEGNHLAKLCRIQSLKTQNYDPLMQNTSMFTHIMKNCVKIKVIGGHSPDPTKKMAILGPKKSKNGLI